MQNKQKMEEANEVIAKYDQAVKVKAVVEPAYKTYQAEQDVDVETKLAAKHATASETEGRAQKAAAFRNAWNIQSTQFVIIAVIFAFVLIMTLIVGVTILMIGKMAHLQA